MKIDDYVNIINPDDRDYRQKARIVGIEQTFAGSVTGYTVLLRGFWKDYSYYDVQYTTKRRRKITPQMQLL
jgi:hypothetical protein